MIDRYSLDLPPGYYLEHYATTIWWLKDPSGHRIQRFSEVRDDNERVEWSPVCTTTVAAVRNRSDLHSPRCITIQHHKM